MATAFRVQDKEKEQSAMPTPLPLEINAQNIHNMVAVMGIMVFAIATLSAFSSAYHCSSACGQWFGPGIRESQGTILKYFSTDLGSCLSTSTFSLDLYVW